MRQYEGMKAKADPDDASFAPLFQAPIRLAEAERLAAALRALADPSRLRILNLIATRPGGEVCQAEFTAPLGLAQPTVSHHLKILHRAGCVRREQRGSWAYYSLATKRMHSLLQALWPGDSIVGQAATAGLAPAPRPTASAGAGAGERRSPLARGRGLR